MLSITHLVITLDNDSIKLVINIFTSLQNEV